MKSKHGKVILTRLNTFVIFCAKKKNMMKIRQFSGTNISRTTEAIFFNFDM